MGRIGRRTITKAKAVETHVSSDVEVIEESKKTDSRIKLIKKKKALKTKPFQIRFSEDEFTKISEFADKEDLNISDLIRLALIEKGVL